MSRLRERCGGPGGEDAGRAGGRAGHLELVHVVDDVAVALEDALAVQLAVGQEQAVAGGEAVAQDLEAADLQHAVDALVDHLQGLREPAPEVAALAGAHDGGGFAAALARELEALVVEGQARAALSGSERHEAADLGAGRVADEDAVFDGGDALQHEVFDHVQIHQLTWIAGVISMLNAQVCRFAAAEQRL